MVVVCRVGLHSLWREVNCHQQLQCHDLLDVAFPATLLGRKGDSQLTLTPCSQSFAACRSRLRSG